MKHSQTDIALNGSTQQAASHCSADNARIASDFTTRKDMSMKTFANTAARRSQIARIVRFACTLLVFTALFAGLRRSAAADVVVDHFAPPQETYGVTPGTTALQLKVRNTDNFTVSGVKVQTYIYFAADTLYGWQVRAMPSSAPFSLAPYESKWITVALPTHSIQGQSLLGQRLYAKALVGSGQYWLNNFLNSPAQANVQCTSADSLRISGGAVVFQITVTNNGYITSSPQTLNVATVRYGDGAEGTPLYQTGSIPALNVGQSYTLTFTSQTTNGYAIHGTAQVGQGNILHFSF